MNTFSGKGKFGLLALFAVLLMPLLGVGTASAFEVGDKVDVVVPDLQQFADPLETHQFTCRAITDHAVWLVQDTSAVDAQGGLGDTTFVPKVVWGDDPDLNMVSPASFNAITTAFENTVWGTVTGICGTPVDIDGDGKVVMILAAMPTKYDAGGGSITARNTMYYVDPAFNEIEGVEMEVAFVNIHPFSTATATMPAAEEMREWSTANALAYLAVSSNDPLEEVWALRGLAEAMQYECFGYTLSTPGGHGHGDLLTEFRKAAYIELLNPQAGIGKYDYAASRGQGFMFFMYLIQRAGIDAIATFAQDVTYTGMESLAMAIDPAADPETAVQDVIVPIYRDWLVCNLHNDFRSDYMDGIYMYDFLEGTEDEDWAHAGMGAAFAISFNSYPIEGTIPANSKAMKGPIWAASYIRFTDVDAAYNTYFNGQYTDGRGARNAINSRWEGQMILCVDSLGQFTSITDMEFDELYNTEFQLQAPDVYMILTNNNPGGSPEMRYYISSDEVPPAVETAMHQNSLMSQYITVYSALINTETSELEGYDWVGPIFEATLGDSTLNIKMASFYETIWTGIFPAWDSGDYTLSFAGYDSTGHYVATTSEVVVGFADTDLDLDLGYARLEVPRGGAPNGAMVTLAETGELGLAVESSASISTARGRMTGIIAGPVSIPDVCGTLSFTSTTSQASIYRYTNDGWVKLESWMQNGEISAAVDQGGIYALGEGAGVFAPELPAQLVLSGNAPNPFSAQTAISFGLPVAGNVRVNVFDMTGRLVTTLANEEMAAANHSLIWDGTDASGSPVGAGVYFCRLETAGQVLTQKMLKVQ